MKSLKEIGGELYIADQLEDSRGWLVWKLKLDSPVYHVGPFGCTCPAEGVCKHMKAFGQQTPKQLEARDPRKSRG